MEPGTNNPCACLLPTGSAEESIEGISHFLEHFIIYALLHRFKGTIIDGHTTEDYVILFCRSLTIENIIETLQTMEFNSADVEIHKERLKKEIMANIMNPGELFFRFVWEGSAYEKSPLGIIDRVDVVSGNMLNTLRHQLLRENIFSYTQHNGIKIYQPPVTVPIQPRLSPKLPVPISWVKNKLFREREYDIFYFNQDIEAFYLLERILKRLNPQKHIQLSEKRRMSALILEKGTYFPTKDQVEAIKQEVLADITLEAAEIKSKFEELALNELESIFFRGFSWPERIESLFKTPAGRLSEIIILS